MREEVEVHMMNSEIPVLPLLVEIWQKKKKPYPGQESGRFHPTEAHTLTLGESLMKQLSP